MKKGFATSWHPGGVNAIVPVIKRMQEDGQVEIVVMGHEFSEPILLKAGITFKTIKDFRVPDISVDSMKNILREVQPSLVFTGTSAQEGKANDMIEHTTTLAARELNIKSLAVLDVWMSYWQRFSDERTGKRLDMLPDYIAIMDKLAFGEMVTEGFPKEKLVITGNPHFDGLFAKAQQFTELQRQQVKQRVGLSCSVLFFFAANAFLQFKPQLGYWDLDVVNLIIKTMPQLPNVGVAVRVHPRLPKEDKEQIAQAISESGVNIKLVDDVDSQTLALTADMTIVENSTMGIEAVYMRRPCISVQPDLTSEDALLISKNGIIPAGYNPADCQKLLVEAMSPQYRNGLLQQSAGFSNDGKATDRVVELVYRLLNS